MYPAQLAEHLAVWLADAQHPGIAQVRTCAQVGWHEQPVGVAVTLTDGWTWILQCVAGSPPGGNANRAETSQAPEPFEGVWADRPDYQEARRTFEAEQKAHKGPRSRVQQAAVASLLGLAAEVIRRQGHVGVDSVEMPDRPVLLVRFADKAMVYARHAGFIPPGSTDLQP